MWLQGLIGLGIGFAVGMAANLYLLRDLPRDVMRRNRDMRLKYGALNWGIALLGMFIALALAQN